MDQMIVMEKIEEEHSNDDIDEKTENMNLYLDE